MHKLINKVNDSIDAVAFIDFNGLFFDRIFVFLEKLLILPLTTQVENSPKTE